MLDIDLDLGHLRLDFSQILFKLLLQESLLEGKLFVVDHNLFEFDAEIAPFLLLQLEFLLGLISFSFQTIVLLVILLIDVLQLTLKVLDLVHSILIDFRVLPGNLFKTVVEFFDLVCESRDVIFLLQVFSFDVLHLFNVFLLGFDNLDGKMGLVFSLEVLLLLKHLLFVLFCLLFANNNLTFELDGLLLLLCHHLGDLLLKELVVLHV